MASNSDIQQSLQESGFTREQSRALTEAFPRRRSTGSDPWMLAFAGVLVAAIGWVVVELGNTRNSIDTLETRMEARLDSMEQSLTRIETILQERLPPPQ